MNEYLKGKNTDPISAKEFEGMLYTLSCMFNEDYSDKNSRGYRKAELTFAVLYNSECKAFEFSETMNYFIKHHTLNYWQPAHIYQIWKNEYEPIAMVM